MGFEPIGLGCIIVFNGHVVSQCDVNQSQCDVNQSWGYWVLFDALVVVISLVVKMQVQCLAPNSLETQDFDTKF
jgi:hypothetical protein